MQHVAVALKMLATLCSEQIASKTRSLLAMSVKGLRNRKWVFFHVESSGNNKNIENFSVWQVAMATRTLGIWID